VLLALPGRRERIHDAPFDPVEVEMLLAHEVEIACRKSAAGRPGVAPRRQRLALGIGKTLDVAVTLTLPVGLQIVPPAIAEIGTQVLERALGMDVAVEDADARLDAVLGAALRLPHLGAHCARSFKSVCRAQTAPAGKSRARTRTNAPGLSAPDAIIGRQRILHQDFAMQPGRYACRDGLVPIELPVRIVRGVEQ